ncbi:hypothetical protein D3C78_235110 [compost metagenome]
MTRSLVEFYLLFGLLASSFLALGACTGTSAVGSAAAGVVSSYCAAPELGRVALRETIAQHTAPNRIRVECAADAL